MLFFVIACYFSGYVLSKNALDKFVNLALKGKGNGNCKFESDDGFEDVELGLCLENVNIKAGDTRDEEGKGRFFPLSPELLLFPNATQPSWYWQYMFYSSLKVNRYVEIAISSYLYLNSFYWF